MDTLTALPQQQQQAPATQSGMMGEVETAFSGQLPEAQEQLSLKLHGAAVDLLHGAMREQTLKLLKEHAQKLPETMGQISANLIEALQSKMGGGLPAGMMLRLLMLVIIELIEIAQAMQLISEDDDEMYAKIIPPAIQYGSNQLSGQAKKRGVVNDAHIQEGQELMNKIGGESQQ